MLQRLRRMGKHFQNLDHYCARNSIIRGARSVRQCVEMAIDQNGKVAWLLGRPNPCNNVRHFVVAQGEDGEEFQVKTSTRSLHIQLLKSQSLFDHFHGESTCQSIHSIPIHNPLQVFNLFSDNAESMNLQRHFLNYFEKETSRASDPLGLGPRLAIFFTICRALISEKYSC